MNINYDGKKFRSVSNTSNGEVSEETIFHYQQNDLVVTATYSGGSIVTGFLIANVKENSVLEMMYLHLNKDSKFMYGRCTSTPEILHNGKIKLKEEWQWLRGDQSKGNSEIIEI